MSSPIDDGYTGPGLIESAMRFWAVVALGVVIGAVAGLLYASRQTEVFEASAQITVTDPQTVGVFRDLNVTRAEPGRYLRNQAEIILSAPVLDRAEELLVGAQTLGELSVVPSTDTDSMTLRARHPIPTGAAASVDAVIAAYEEAAVEEVSSLAERTVAQLEPVAAELETRLARLEEQLVAQPNNRAIESQYSSVSTQLSEIRRRARGAEIDAAIFGSGIGSREPAAVPSSPVEPRPRRMAAIGGFIGLLLGAAYAWWLNLKARSREHLAEALLQAPLLGSIPDFEAGIGAKLRGAGRSSSPIRTGRGVRTEPYDFVAASLSLTLRDVEGSVVVVTSMVSGEGKSMTALHLALAASRSGKSVLVLDADVHRSQLHTVVPELDQGPFLSDLSDGEGSVQAHQWGPTGEAVHVIRIGRNGDVRESYFRSDAFRMAVDALRRSFDLIVIDSAPLVPVLDTVDVGEVADAMLLVVTPRVSPSAFAEGVRRLRHISTPVVGYVKNRYAEQEAIPAYGYAEQPAGRSKHPAEHADTSVADRVGASTTAPPGAEGRSADSRRGVTIHIGGGAPVAEVESSEEGRDAHSTPRPNLSALRMRKSGEVR